MGNTAGKGENNVEGRNGEARELNVPECFTKGEVKQMMAYFRRFSREKTRKDENDYVQVSDMDRVPALSLNPMVTRVSEIVFDESQRDDLRPNEVDFEIFLQIVSVFHPATPETLKQQCKSTISEPRVSHNIAFLTNSFLSKNQTPKQPTTQTPSRPSTTTTTARSPQTTSSTPSLAFSPVSPCPSSKSKRTSFSTLPLRSLLIPARSLLPVPPVPRVPRTARTARTRRTLGTPRTCETRNPARTPLENRNRTAAAAERAGARRAHGGSSVKDWAQRSSRRSSITAASRERSRWRCRPRSRRRSSVTRLTKAGSASWPAGRSALVESIYLPTPRGIERYSYPSIPIRSSWVMDKSALAAETAAAVGLARDRWEALSQQGTAVGTQLANRLIETSYTGDAGNWASLEANATVRSAVATKKQMTAMRLELLTKMEAIIMELEARYTEFKALVYRFEQSCDALSRINRNDYRYALSTLLDSEYLLKEVLLSLGQDLQCKKDVFKGLKDLSLNPQAFNAATHEHLTLYLGIWSEMPYIDMRKFRLAEVALLAEI